MSYAVEALATGPEGAVKLSVVRKEHPSVDQLQDYKAQASGFYRRQYSAWCAHHSVSVRPLPDSGG